MKCIKQHFVDIKQDDNKGTVECHENFKQESQRSTWIYRLTLNICLTLQKRRKKSKNQQPTEALPDVISEENHAFKNESLNLLFDAIRHLSELDRAIILLYLEERSYQEIADVIGTNPNNIGVRITRIKTRLQHLLSEMETV